MVSNSERQTIAIVGGTFDPVHFGHLRLSEELAEALHCYSNKLSVRLMVVSQPPHRSQPVVAANKRAEMVKLAISDSETLEVDEREINRDGVSFSYLSIEELAAEYPDARLIWVLGDDAFEGLDKWRNWQAICKAVSFIVVARPGARRHRLNAEVGKVLTESTSIEQLMEKSFGSFFRYSGPNLDISSTQIRELLQQKRSCRFLLPDSVIEYIQQYRLYEN
ncbi:MAG: nicotinate-nucleotide adenylyltransferase [Gammaproteobacteria bacterium]|nr:nicotinate-nucleotide adenylyltransferase [Gammaproteobacteria bacterium]